MLSIVRYWIPHVRILEPVEFQQQLETCITDAGFMDWTADLIGMLLLVAGGVLGMKARKRKFDRTNPYGVERFPSYMTKMASKTKDHVLNGGAIMLLGSGTLLLSYNHMATWGWIVWLPIALFMLFALIGT